jgi:hypothetical protein
MVRDKRYGALEALVDEKDTVCQILTNIRANVDDVPPTEHDQLGCPPSHDPLLHTSLRGWISVGVVISYLNRVIMLVEGTSGTREERYFHGVRIKHSLRGLHFLV